MSGLPGIRYIDKAGIGNTWLVFETVCAPWVDLALLTSRHLTSASHVSRVADTFPPQLAFSLHSCCAWLQSVTHDSRRDVNKYIPTSHREPKYRCHQSPMW